MIVLVGFLTKQGGDVSTQIDIIDESGIFADKFKDEKPVDFSISTQSLADAKKKIINEENGFVLVIPKDYSQGEIQLLSQKKANFLTLDVISSQMNSILKSKMLVDAGIDQQTLDNIQPDVSITSKEISTEGEKESSSGAAYGIGFAAAIMIYMSLFIYGAQVMRGVIEEKTNRIIEVVISSVKPFQLMLGKIIGIGLVGLTQFLLWVILSTTLMTLASSALAPENNVNTEQSVTKQNPELNQQNVPNSPLLSALNTLESVPFGFIITIFFVYFFGGYMLYSALFAAVGSAVDSDTETQQFMLPITLPLLFTYILSFSFIVNNPDSTLSFWLSIIPFTSPIAMMVRLPFGVPDWQLALSIVLLIGGFIFTTWVASRIYRVGILMYGKKASYKELVKWFRYKE
jgi:ABC-2 type transport system permease protein